MFNINFNKPFIRKELQNYIKTVNENSIKKINETFNRSDIFKIKKLNKQHTSDYEFDFCDLSEDNDTCDNDDFKKIDKINEIGINQNISFILAFLGGSSIISFSLLYYYNIYIKK